MLHPRTAGPLTTGGAGFVSWESTTIVSVKASHAVEYAAPGMSIDPTRVRGLAAGMAAGVETVAQSKGPCRVKQGDGLAAGMAAGWASAAPSKYQTVLQLATETATDMHAAVNVRRSRRHSTGTEWHACTLSQWDGTVGWVVSNYGPLYSLQQVRAVPGPSTASAGLCVSLC